MVWYTWLNKEYLKIILIIACILFVCTTIYLIIDILCENRLSKRDKAYIRNFSSAFDETNDLKLTLSKMLTMYGKKTKEYKAITKALNYLQNSIYGDYETAAFYIEDALYNKKIHETHQIAIQISIKKLSHFSLTDKQSENM